MEDVTARQALDLIDPELAQEVAGELEVHSGERTTYVSVNLFNNPALLQRGCERVIDVFSPSVDAFVAVSRLGSPFAVSLAWFARARSPGAAFPQIAFLNTEDLVYGRELPVPEHIKNKRVLLCDDLARTVHNLSVCAISIHNAIELLGAVVILDEPDAPRRDVYLPPVRALNVPLLALARIGDSTRD